MLTWHLIRSWIKATHYVAELGPTPPRRYLERPSPCENEIKLEFVDKQKIPSYAEAGEFWGLVYTRTVGTGSYM